MTRYKQWWKKAILIKTDALSYVFITIKIFLSYTKFIEPCKIFICLMYLYLSFDRHVSIEIQREDVSYWQATWKSKEKKKTCGFFFFFWSNIKLNSDEWWGSCMILVLVKRNLIQWIFLLKLHLEYFWLSFWFMRMLIWRILNLNNTVR